MRASRRPRHYALEAHHRRPFVAAVIVVHRDDTDVAPEDHVCDSIAMVTCPCGPELVSAYSDARA